MSEPVVATKRMIEELFDASAPAYDRAGPPLFSQFGERLVGHLPIVHGMQILDIATGTGAVLVPAAQRTGPKGQVVGIDQSGRILAEADRAVRARGLGNVALHKMDAERLEFPDRSFDIVTCAFAIFLFPDPDTALREMRRVLRPDGYLGISVFSSTPPAFSPAWPLLLQQFGAYHVGVRMPGPLAYAPADVEGLLTRFGFDSVVSRSETSDVVYASAEDWWTLLLTLGPRPTILGMDDDTRARFMEEYLEKLRPLFAEDGLHLPASVVYATGRR